jgi:hypothetical protein
MVLHVDLATRRVAPFPAPLVARLAALARTVPLAGSGRRIGMGRGG